MSQRYRRSARQVYREIAGEHLLIDLHSKSTAPFFALTPSAVTLWHALDRWSTLEELVAVLCDRYDVDEATAAADAREFLSQLETIGGIDSQPGEVS